MKLRRPSKMPSQGRVAGSLALVVALLAEGCSGGPTTPPGADGSVFDARASDALPTCSATCAGACVDLASDEAHCGACERACTDDGRTREVCIAGSCVVCGGSGEPCCEDVRNAPCAGDLRCTAASAGASRCEPPSCGVAGTPCCPGDACEGSLSCIAGSCVLCGGVGQPCCDGLCEDRTNYCVGGSVCRAPRACTSVACDIEENGCTEGEGCYFSGFGGAPPSCATEGSGTDRAPCTTEADCASGHHCWNGECRAICCDIEWSLCEPAGYQCYAYLATTGLCLPPHDCDPLVPTADCAAGQTCYWNAIRDGSQCATTGTSTGSCTRSSDCMRGFACHESTCRRVCRLPGTTDCGAACTSVGSTFFPSLGVCVFPEP